ncbi:MAG: DUF2080 family transposase-associated protein [Nanoarchaeota archaeon]|nr:DUF2080 family transposase-associated protein [Nanoarchaeota archaeon]MBU1027584.1 DUF2080 family transposase-associated protein [Nanoarchaeota archaeon]
MKKTKSAKRIELNSREFKINLDRFQKDFKKIYASMKKIIPEKVKDIKIQPFRNSSHIILPKKYVNKKAIVIVKK